MSETGAPRLASESIAGQRPYQEDAVLHERLSDGRLLLAVADGMGGHAAGDVASALALESLKRGLEDGKSLGEAVSEANAEVHRKSKEPGKHGMGTTLVAAIQDGGELLLANVGDSRGYVLTGSGIRQVSRDHSFVAEAIRRGQSEEEAKSSRWKDALTRSIGTEPSVEVDVFGPFPVEANSALLLCSDGLYKTLTDDDLAMVFRASGGPRGAAQSLTATAFDRGSDDNISVVVAEWGEVPRERPAGTMPLEYDPPDGHPTAAATGAEPEPDDPPDEGDDDGDRPWWRKVFS